MKNKLLLSIRNFLYCKNNTTKLTKFEELDRFFRCLFTNSENITLNLSNTKCENNITDNVFGVKKFSFIVFGFSSYKSDNIYDYILKYLSQGIPCVFFCNKLDKSDALYIKHQKISSYSNVFCIELDKEKDYNQLDLLRFAIEKLQTEFITLVTSSCKLNPRSYIDTINQIVTNNIGFNLYLNATDFSILKECLNISTSSTSSTNSSPSLKQNTINKFWDISHLSTLVIRRDYFQNVIGSISKDCLFVNGSEKACRSELWIRLLMREILSSQSSQIFFYDDSSLHKRIIPRNISVSVISALAKVTFERLSKPNLTKIDVDVALEALIAPIEDIFKSCNLTSKLRACLYITIAYSLYLSEIQNMSVEDWKEKFFIATDFCHKISNKDVKEYFNYLIEKLVKKEHNRIFIVENYGIDDIKQSVFFVKISEKYQIDYQLKRSNFDYYHLNNLIIKIHSKVAQLTISSGSLSRDMLNEGDNHLTLWHGLGWMKKTEVKPKMFTVGTIVCSSAYCEDKYKEHFVAENSVGLGSVQTDILFDEAFIKKSRKEVGSKYSIPQNAQILFFAPTFRIGKEYQYYNFGIDIEELSEELAKNNIYLITKKHHILDAVMRDKGIDTSGVFNSTNLHFIVDDSFNFVQLLASADCFATDYSSGMYYAFLRNLPIFLYATDVEEYRNGRNGFEIDYPADVPVPFVSSNSIDEFMQGYFDSFNYPHTEKYQLYKRNNIGACDGFVAERVLDYIRNNYFKDL